MGAGLSERCRTAAMERERKIRARGSPSPRARLILALEGKTDRVFPVARTRAQAVAKKLTKEEVKQLELVGAAGIAQVSLQHPNPKP